MKLKHTDNYSKKYTIAVFVKIDKEIPAVQTFSEEHKSVFEKLVKEKNYAINMPFASGSTKENRLLFVSFREVKNYTEETWKKAGAALISAMKENKITDIDVDMSALFAEIASADSYTAFCTGILLAGYTFTKYLGERRIKELNIIKHINLVSEHKKDIAYALEMAEKIARSVCFARDLINEPSNAINALTFSQIMKKETSERKITATILDEKQIKALGMNGLLGVNAGSKIPPRVFIGHYKHTKAKNTIVLVGKGITFDTGGISLKTADGMYTMKDDMAGAASVLSALCLIADKQLEANVIAIAPLTDNKTGSGAINPGDILKMYNGTTVEILSTDAEGRLILADALAYGIEKYKPDYIIDIATLTGACSVALGKWASAVMGNDKFLINTIKEAGEETYERVWELPMFDEYKEHIKSSIADIQNTGGRMGGAILAGQFLSYFTEKAKWAHIDIAGTSYFDKASGYLPQGATGVGVQLLTRTVEKLIEKN